MTNRRLDEPAASGPSAGPAVLLVAAFVPYVRTRWPELSGRGTGAVRPGAIRLIQRLLAISSATEAVGYGALHLVWAVRGGQVDGDADGIETAAQQTFWASRDSSASSPLLGFVHLLGAVIGLPLGIAALLVVVERRDPANSVTGTKQ